MHSPSPDKSHCEPYRSSRHDPELPRKHQNQKDQRSAPVPFRKHAHPENTIFFSNLLSRAKAAQNPIRRHPSMPMPTGAPMKQITFRLQIHVLDYAVVVAQRNEEA